MGIMSWMGGGEVEEADEAADGDDDFFGAESDDGDDFDMGDGMDGLDDDDDGFGEMGGGGGGQAVEELENRVEELESEVAQMSSTMNTVRSENEEIATSVDETEENVRKLLEIYEMVTRGVNPFVDDGGGMSGDAFGNGNFGLFDDTGQEESSEEELDEDIADADAESFFDDDAFDDVDDEDEDITDELDADLDADEEIDDAASGTSFQDLKEEYESGEADWIDGEETEAGAELEDEAADDAADGSDEPEFEVELDELADEPGTGDEPDGELDAEPADGRDDEFEYEGAVDPEQDSTDRSPYLASLPEGYVADVVVMEWLDHLVSEFGAENAVRTVEYYQEIGWVGEPAKEQLMDFLSGFADVESADDAVGPVEMGVDDHIRSLTFISQLTGDSAEKRIVEHCSQLRGEGRGIQC